MRRGDHFDIVVTDHLMPGMTGSELAHLIRAEMPTIRVILISGYSEVEGIDPTLPRLTKPFRNDELAIALAQLTSC
jgi:YesN/AraC family two-component response regulator